MDLRKDELCVRGLSNASVTAVQGADFRRLEHS